MQSRVDISFTNNTQRTDEEVIAALEYSSSMDFVDHGDHGVPAHYYDICFVPLIMDLMSCGERVSVEVVAREPNDKLYVAFDVEVKSADYNYMFSVAVNTENIK